LLGSRASSSTANGLAARRLPVASTVHGASGTCSARAATSCPVPASPRIRIGRRTDSRCSSERSTSRTGGEAPSAASDTCRGPRAIAVLSARATVVSSFCRPIGFSRKSNAPTLVASTAVSMVPWPDIITTGMVS
jgi:hypothetical protein